MKFGIRLRFALWLLAALLPVGIAAVYVFGRMETEVSQQVAADLVGLRTLEATRIETGLDLYRDRATSLASESSLRTLVSQVLQARASGEQNIIVGGADGFAEVEALADQPLRDTVIMLNRHTDASTTELQIRDLNGQVLGSTPSFDWEPVDDEIIERSTSLQRAIVGDAFRDRDGNHRLGLVVPILAPDGEPIASLLLENRLGPIVDLVGAHEGMGDTSEAHIAQRNAQGDAEFITLLRFERDAAFNKVVPGTANVPIIQSLDAPDGLAVVAPDYRGEESILAIETIEETGWGLVVKIDRAEALAAVTDYSRALKGVGALGVLGVLLGWAAFLDPIARRLLRLSEGAERVASGEYSRPLDDRRSDEIASVAKSIDRLATDLATDIAVRSDIEDRLRHQATHDLTTGLFNRQYATSLMTEMATPEDAATARGFSLLFLDLDNFKAINDVYGHATGDEVLATTAGRLADAVGDRGSVARWGGDEFIVVLPGMYEGAAQDMALEVQRSFEPAVETAVGVHQVRASVGASTYHPGSDSLETLLHSADEAMFAVKENRSGRRTISPESVRAVEQALEDDNVEVWLQPIVTGSGSNVSLTGAEALVRLRDRSGAVLKPGLFLGDVERSHVGRDLDRRMIRESLTLAAKWIHDERLRHDFQLSINCCEALMRDDSTPGFIEEVLGETGLAPENLVLEISEQSSRMQAGVMHELRSLGVRIAIDDLGMNNSNIDRLIDSGAQIAKIDRRWMEIDSGACKTNLVVLRHLVSLCDALGYEIIAQGVESPEQYAQLVQLGVSTFQGYLFSTPLSGEDFARRFLLPGFTLDELALDASALEHVN